MKENRRAVMNCRIDFEIAALVDVFQKIRHRDRLLRGEKLDVEISLTVEKRTAFVSGSLKALVRSILAVTPAKSVWFAICVLITGGAFAATASGAAAENARRKTMARFIEGSDCNRSAKVRHPAVSAARIIF